MDSEALASFHTGIDLRLHAYAPGGISRYARRLARAISELFTPGALTLIHHRRAESSLLLPGVRNYAVWTPPHHRMERWALGFELFPLDLDIFHATDFIPPAWGARFRVTTIHDLNFLYYPQYLTKRALQYYNGQIAWAVTHAHAIIVDSYATCRDLINELHVPEDRVTVVHLAADAHFKQLTEVEFQPVLAQLGLDLGYFLFVGTWEPRKNIPGLLNAFARFCAKDKQKTLVIAGRPGWLYESIYQQIQELGIEPRVRFIQQPSFDQLSALYNG
ncbi:MAG: glycosyltransferase family 1 protein, partial [Anaerolineae bacterium]|nr:glycosyltransferase family 1 protein [Anaerolineae bacterium]